MYQGSEAYSLYGVAGEREQEVHRHAPFGVVTGGGLDAKVRQGISHVFFSRFVLVMAAVAVFVCCGVVRVALSATTVVQMQQTASLRQDIASAQSTNKDLQAERSVLSSSSRIDHIAGQCYGMVRADSCETLTIGSPAAGSQASLASSSAQDASAPASSADAAQSSNAGGSASMQS
ncbi:MULTISPECIES: cell division protein FtsL [Atopobiaceae]|uniref:Cell division protein FtsL n=1 Tax=Parafannyhessea umbonata TaxID=604330 RepID=A0A1H9NFR7_9ACTN|nr:MULTISPECIES: cell division protein FtsL [Atopobiaceae]SEH53880.1 cell division protein FtsL [Parafannyhessea umbonata]SER34786.1 cell division protein FtsL [Parafannyhessea umbonata]SJZ46848.1 cell division protein FtsL [Olsenella sp. KH1P3]